jgi:hypothetical protein
MALWEFALALDGERLGQTALAEGADEATAASSAARAVAEHPALILQRPGWTVAADVEARWREVCGDAFPIVASDIGRLALYARGLPDPSRAPHAGVRAGVRTWWQRWRARLDRDRP